MTEELQVVKGEKVGEIWGPRNSDRLMDIYTVVSVSKKGTITVETKTGRRYQYGSDGYSKGQASGWIRKLEEGEEEKFLAEKKMEREEVNRKIQEREANRVRKLEKCREWANKWAVLHPEITTVNVTLYVVSLPIPDKPCTLVLRFDKRFSARPYIEDERYSVSISIHETEGEHITGGQTSTNSTEIAPLEISAEWMSVWVDVDKLGE